MNTIENLLRKKTANIKCLVNNFDLQLKNISAELKWNAEFLELEFLTVNSPKLNDKNYTFDVYFVNGEKFTLTCHLSSYNFGFTCQMIFKVITLIENDSSEDFQELQLQLNTFPEWVKLNAIIYSQDENEYVYEKVEILKNNPIIHEISIDNTNVQIMFKNRVTRSGEDYRKYLIEQRAFINIISESKHKKEWFIEIALKIRDLLTILIGEKISISDLKFKKEKLSIPISYYNVNYIDNTVSKTPWYNILFSYEDLSRNFNVILSNWFSLIKNESVYSTLKLFISNFYMEQFLENTFLNYMQGLEGYHREMYGGGYIDEKDFRNDRKKIEGFITSLKLSDDLKTSIIDRLRYSYQYSLQKRIEELLVEIPPQILKFVLSEDEKIEFIKHIKKFRNVLSHSSNKEKIDFEEFININEKLKTIFMLLIVIEIGVEESTIIKCLNKGTQIYFIPNKDEIVFEVPNL